MFVKGAIGRSGRKRAKKASQFLLGGSGGFLTASSLLAAVGLAWGVYDSLQGAAASVPPPGAAPSPTPPVAPPPPGGAAATAAPLPTDVERVVRLAVSAANADGTLTDAERAAVLARATEAGVGDTAAEELARPRPLAEIVSGVRPEQRPDLYVLAFAIVRADDGVSGAERVYLAQLAHALGLDAATVSALEAKATAAIDQAPPGATPAQ